MGFPLRAKGEEKSGTGSTSFFVLPRAYALAAHLKIIFQAFVIHMKCAKDMRRPPPSLSVCLVIVCVSVFLRGPFDSLRQSPCSTVKIP